MLAFPRIHACIVLITLSQCLLTLCSSTNSHPFNLRRRSDYGDVLTFPLGRAGDLDLTMTVTFLDMNSLPVYETIQAALTAQAAQWGDASPDSKVIVTKVPTDDLLPGYIFLEKSPRSIVNLDATMLHLLSDSLFSSLKKAQGLGFSLDRNFRATIQAPSLQQDRREQLQIWLNSIPSNILAGEKRPNADTNANDVKHVYKVKEEIMRLSRPQDLIIFLGNTASYFYFSFDACRDNRNTHLAPFSGKPYNRPDSRSETISVNKKAAYNTHILRPIFSAWNSDRKGKLAGGRVILVDHTRTGAGVEQFADLIEDTGNSEMWSDVYLINLQYANTPYASMRTLASTTLLADVVVGDTIEDLERFDLGTIGRLIPYWGKEMWFLSRIWMHFPLADAQWREQSINMFKAGPGAAAVRRDGLLEWRG